MGRTVGNRLTPARASLLGSVQYINMHAIALHLQLCACRAPLNGAATTAASSSASAVDPSPPWGVCRQASARSLV